MYLYLVFRVMTYKGCLYHPVDFIGECEKLTNYLISIVLNKN